MNSGAMWFSGLLLIGGGLLLAPLGCKPRGEAASGVAGYSHVESEPESSEVGRRMPQRESAKREAAKRQSAEGSAAADTEWLSSFELIERSGKVVRSEDLKGQPYVVGFFFTLCPSICLNQNGKVQELQEKYLGQPIRFLSISCDPEVDRPEVLAEYAERFQADKDQWLFLTGEMDYIARVAAEMYFMAASRRFHAEKFVLVDAQGENVGFYSWGDPAQFQALQRDIDKLLAADQSSP